MARVNVKIGCTVADGSVNYIPLQRVFVEHVVFGVPAGLYITDDQGNIRDENGDLGVSLPGVFSDCDIRLIPHNSVIKHQDGLAWSDFHVANGDHLILNEANTQHIRKFRKINDCLKVYDTVFRQFDVFNVVSKRDWPLGNSGSLHAKKNRAARLELDDPSGFPGVHTSFTEPSGLMTSGYPIVHIIRSDRMSTVAAEMAHALHFSYVGANMRGTIQRDYLAWLVGMWATGGDTGHNLGAKTSPLIAFIEALDWFSTSFFDFSRANPNRTGSGLRNDFIRDRIISGDFCGFSGDMLSGVVLAPRYTGTDDEGAVAAAIFLDFARRPGVGLKTAVNAYFKSKALSFGQYRSWVEINKPALATAIRDVALTWGL